MEIICPHRHICNLACNLCAITDGNADISCRQCRRIIDTITDHDHLSSGILFCLNKACFIFRQYLGMILIHTDFLCNCRCHAVTVSGHHNNLGDSEFL